MKRIDAHQHFWEYQAAEYPWIKSEWPIRKSFLPKDLEPLLRQCEVDGSIAVQARQTLQETEWLLKLADEAPLIAGVVGWVDLRSEKVAEQLGRFKDRRKLVGVRHVVQDEPDDRFLLGREFVRGLKMLKEFNLAYDLLIFPHQLPAAVELVQQLPEQPFVLDHIAKPQIAKGMLEPWVTLIRELAAAPNVSCKLSGMVTEAKWRAWKPEDFRPYLDVVWDAFGPDRLMIGSDWPVCLLSADYNEAIGLVTGYLQQFTVAEREKVLGANAVRFYRLPI